MISAGRVLLMPKGAYDPSTTYEMLDIVSYNGSSYIAKGTTTGNLPTDTTYWQLSAYGGQAANIAGNFAELEVTSVASMTHYADDIFVDENSQLMKATQTINIGDTIDVNTNCTPTTVEALITSLSDRVDSLDSTNRKLQGAIEIAAQTDLHSLALGEYYKSQTSFYVTNAPVGINQVTSAKFRLTVEAALANASQASSPLLLTLRTPDGKIFTQGYDGSAWSTWEQSAAKSAVDGLWDNTMDNGAVNMLPNNATSLVDNGITYTVNDDGSITANGTATGESSISCSTKLKKGTYRFSGVPKTGSYSSYWSYYQKDGVTQGSDIGDGLVFSLDSEATINCVFRIKTGYTASNLTFYPMISVASYNSPYVPYAKSNRELTEETDVTFTASANETEIVSYKIKKRDGHVYGYIDAKVLATTIMSFGTLSEKPSYTWAQSACNSSSRARPVGICYVTNSGAIVCSPVNAYSVNDRIQVAIDFYIA